jgi:hypothetical protein
MQNNSGFLTSYLPVRVNASLPLLAISTRSVSEQFIPNRLAIAREFNCCVNCFLAFRLARTSSLPLVLVLVVGFFHSQPFITLPTTLPNMSKNGISDVTICSNFSDLSPRDCILSPMPIPGGLAFASSLSITKPCVG